MLLLWQIQQESDRISIEEDGETLVVGGFRFETATSREGLRRLSSQAGAEGLQNDTWLMATRVVSIRQGQQGQMTGRGNNGRQRAILNDMI